MESAEHKDCASYRCPVESCPGYDQSLSEDAVSLNDNESQGIVTLIGHDRDDI